jgi:predicted nucleic acid-binding protein
MPAVADSSVIIHLAAIGQIDLLRQLYTSVLLPPAVWNEVVVQGRGRVGEKELQQARGDGWVTVAAHSANVSLPSECPALHPGEAEAILMAGSQPGRLLLMDEAAGRSVATSLGIPVTGIVGILVLAKQRGLISELKPILEQLRDPGGFRLSAAVIQHALTLAGEQP